MTKLIHPINLKDALRRGAEELAAIEERRVLARYGIYDPEHPPLPLDDEGGDYEPLGDEGWPTSWDDIA